MIFRMRKAYEGYPFLVGMDTRSFKRDRTLCQCENTPIWVGGIVYRRSITDFLKVRAMIDKCGLIEASRSKRLSGMKANWEYKPVRIYFLRLTKLNLVCGRVFRSIPILRLNLELH